MNYLKAYVKLIKRAKTQPEPETYEKHHVFPKSIYGENDYVVKLSPRQHYIAHLLLYRGFVKRYGCSHNKTIKMLAAIWYMSHKCVANARIYEMLRTELIVSYRERFSGKNNPHYGSTHSEETRTKMKLAAKNRRPVTEETRTKMAEAQRRRFSDKTNHPQFGKPVTEETKKKLSQNQKGKPKPQIAGRKWFNNGEQMLFTYECPPGFVPGRLKRGPMHSAQNDTSSSVG